MNRFLVVLLIVACAMASQHKDDVQAKIEKVD